MGRSVQAPLPEWAISKIFLRAQPCFAASRSGRGQRRYAAQSQAGLREPDGARVQGLCPSVRRQRPIVGHPLQQGRLDHELSDLDKLGQRLLLAQSCVQIDLFRPVEADPYRAAAFSLLIEEPPQRFHPPGRVGLGGEAEAPFFF